MKNVRLSGLILLGLLVSLSGRAADLTIEVSGYENTDGNVVVGLYGKDNDFPVKGGIAVQTGDKSERWQSSVYFCRFA